MTISFGRLMRALLLIAVVAVLAALLPSPAGAQERPADSPRGARAGACTLSPNADNDSEEFTSCISVDAELSHAPALGQTAVLTVDVVGEYGRPDTLVTIDLPHNLEFAEVPAGMSLGVAKALHGQGQLQRASQRRDLTGARPVRYQTRVRAIAEGPATIRTRAAAQGPLGRDAGGEELFITVGAKGEPSRLGHPDLTTTAAVPVPAETPRADSPSVPQSDGPRQPPLQDSLSAPSAPGGACVSGHFGFTDNTGVFRSTRNFGVEVWDADASGGDDHLANGLTDLSGNYLVCVDDVDVDQSGNVDLYVVFASENSRWKVTDFANNQYRFTGPTAANVSGTHDFGSLQPSLSGTSLHPAVQAFDNAHDAYVFTPRSAQGCWDRNDSSCRQLKIMWSTSSTDGNHMHPELNTVHLTASGASSPSTVVHEIGHWLMDEIYDDSYPPFPNCSPHDIPTASSQGCAWTEGFAEWYPARVYGDPTYYYDGGGSRDLEGTTWDAAGWDDGDTVEGRVAAALIDLSDTDNEGPWDRYTEGDDLIWNTFIGHRSATFSEFWQHRSNDGYVVDDANGLSALYQSTVDYGLRDPLGDYAETTRRVGRPHNFSYTSTSPYWSAVAIRPGDDADLSLYDDRPMGSFLTQSTAGGTTMDFVAVNGNLRPLGDYYPQVYGGSASYDIELAQGSNLLTVGDSVSLGFDTGDIVAVRDVNLTAGAPYFLRANPADGQDVELFLLPAGNSVASRANAVASSIGVGAGGTEWLTYTPSATGWYGLVVLNKSGSGGVTTTVTDGWNVTATATGTGTGYIHSNPAGIDNCSTSCSHDFGISGSMTLSASPAAGSTFTGWGGDCSGTGTCNVTLDGDKEVTANFALQARNLAVDFQGSGSGRVTSNPTGIDCTFTCDADFDDGTDVTLTAVAHAGSVFTGWDVTNCPGTGDCVLQLNADNTVRPTFDIDIDAVDDTAETVETNPVTIPVSQNDPGMAPIVEHSQGSRGSTVDCSPGDSCVYTPADDVRSGTETFTYTVESGPITATATVTVSVNPCPELDEAIAGQVDLVTGQTWVACSGLSANATSTTTTPMLPAPDGEFGVLTSGDASLIDNEVGAYTGGNERRGAFDVSILKLDLAIPEQANCLSFDMVFASDEYPDFVGSQYNDAFIAELGESTWEVDDAANIVAPNNFAMDSSGAIMSINSAVFDGGGTTTETGTGWSGATGLLHATTPVQPGAETLYLSIFDQGDSGYDSAALVDSLQATHEPDGGCAAGVNVPPQHSDDTATTEEDVPVDITVATDVDADALTVELLTQPEHGMATVNNVADGQGVITYVPDTNWHGTDALQFSAADGQETIDGQVSITVDPVDDAPQADDAGIWVPTTGTTPIALQATDAEGDDLTFEIVDGPTQGSLGSVGTATCNAGLCEASVDYTPADGAVGPDTFSYRAVDGTVAPANGDLTRLESALTTVTVNFGELDVDAPDLTGLKVTGGLNRATLNWTNPSDTDFTSLVIVMTEGATPVDDPSDGIQIYSRTRPADVIGTGTTVTGLVPKQRYTFTAFAADDADEPNVDATSVGLRGSDVTLTATPTTVVGTQKATLRAVLKRDDGAAMSGRTLRLFGRLRNSKSTSLSPLASATTNSSGVATFARNLEQHWLFAVRFDGAPAATGSWSTTKSVLYRPSLTGTLGKSKLQAGKSTALSGAISPHYKGRTIYLQKLIAGEWANVANKTLGAPTTTTPSVIKYSFSISPPKGEHSYRVRFPSKLNVHSVATTPKRTITVTKT